MHFPSSGLYAITQTENKSPDSVVQDVEAALRGGAQAIQYRDKQPQDAIALALRLLALCRRFAVPLIINDDADLALRVGADGVHLGKDDGSIGAAREKLGQGAIIGVSCYDSVERAVAAAAQGATYVAFGRFFSSQSKPLASPAHLETLRQAKSRLRIPIVAIGGILPENGAQLLEAGADVLAVIGGVFDRDPENTARRFQELFRK
ncbi:MAG: thiamine phosphate synthase [Gammaproteobacteria bacterium]